MTDQPDDDRDRASDPDAHADVGDGGRRSVWSRRIAVALLVTFGAFVLLNVAVVLALLFRSVGPGAGPLGH
jgi:hypothetical protein